MNQEWKLKLCQLVSCSNILWCLHWPLCSPPVIVGKTARKPVAVKRKKEKWGFFLSLSWDQRRLKEQWAGLNIPEVKWKLLSHVQLFAIPWTIYIYRIYIFSKGRILEWVGCPFSSRSSQPRRWTGVSCIADGFFTNWATREALIEIPWSLNRERCEHS